MSARKRSRTGRGDLGRWVSALGLVLVAGGLGVSLAPRVFGGAAPPTDAHPATATKPRPVEVAPQVVLQKINAVGGPGKPSRDPAAGVPVGLVVPQLGVDAPVVGITAPGGVLTPPGDPRTLGWWSDGAVAGAARGSVLITGHTVHTGGGAFDDLETLQPGDGVQVRTAKGLVDYAVTEVTIYRKASLARHAESVFDQSVPGRLVLVTCEDWNGTTYLSNAVVFASPRRSR